VLGPDQHRADGARALARASRGTPLVCVNTVHLPSVYPVVMPDALTTHNETAHWLFQKSFLKLADSTSASAYNGCDGLVVLSNGLKQYWASAGSPTPIHVMPRCVEPRSSTRPGADPFPRGFRKGARLLVVCRHTREKAVERLLEIFARYIAPANPDATLTLARRRPRPRPLPPHRRGPRRGRPRRPTSPGSFRWDALPHLVPPRRPLHVHLPLGDLRPGGERGPLVGPPGGGLRRRHGRLAAGRARPHRACSSSPAPTPRWPTGASPARRSRCCATRAAGRCSPPTPRTRAHDRSAPHKMLDRFLDAFEAARATATPPPGAARRSRGSRGLPRRPLARDQQHRVRPRPPPPPGRRQPPRPPPARLERPRPAPVPAVPAPPSHARLG
jgi:hypothetical protein